MNVLSYKTGNVFRNPYTTHIRVISVFLQEKTSMQEYYLNTVQQFNDLFISPITNLRKGAIIRVR